MAEGTYEYECMRAELLGIPNPTQAEFEEIQKQRQENEVEEEAVETLKAVEEDNENIKTTHGKVDELNAILSTTQQKINKLKCACGSLTTYFKFRSLASSASNSNNASPAHTAAPPKEGTSINDALDTLEDMKNVENQSDVQFAKNDLQKKASSHLGALDSLLAKTESAQASMQKQNKQMKRMLD